MTGNQPIRGETIAVVGLGYVGLPLAVEFDREEFDVIGYDVDPGRVEKIDSGIDPTEELGDETIDAAEFTVTSDAQLLEQANYIIIAVPTPVNELKNPNLTYVERAGETIGRHMREGATVVLESTVYPGATREILIPAIESTSGLKAGESFFVGYSPERMVPGDDEHGIRNVTKIVSGQTEEVTNDLAALYGQVVDAGIHRAPDIKVAEVTKCIENVQRDINIALVNELAVACYNLGIDTDAVLEAAATKWNFQEYRPGLVGGHCIPVDPFFIICESERNGFTPKLIEMGREVNEYMPKHVAKLTLHGLNDCGKVFQESTVLVLGLSYKPGVGDIRSSVVDETIVELQDYGIEVIGYDPYADNDEARKTFGIEIQDELDFEGADGVLLATPHEEFRSIEFTDVSYELADSPLLVDVDGVIDREEIAKAPLAYKKI